MAGHLAQPPQNLLEAHVHAIKRAAGHDGVAEVRKLRRIVDDIVGYAHLRIFGFLCVIFATDLGSAWVPVTNFPAAPTNRTLQAVVPAPDRKKVKLFGGLRRLLAHVGQEPELIMNTNTSLERGHRALRRFAVWLMLAASLSLAGRSTAASVGPAGYTNDFTLQPAAADWATVSIPGLPADTYDLDTDVATNLNVNASTISFQVVSNANNPPSQLTNATWGTNGFL